MGVAPLNFSTNRTSIIYPYTELAFHQHQVSEYELNWGILKVVLFGAGACEKVASDLRLGGDFRRLLRLSH